jgi:hypothetical protein
MEAILRGTATTPITTRPGTATCEGPLIGRIRPFTGTCGGGCIRRIGAPETSPSGRMSGWNKYGVGHHYACAQCSAWSSKGRAAG